MNMLQYIDFIIQFASQIQGSMMSWMWQTYYFLCKTKVIIFNLFSIVHKQNCVSSLQLYLNSIMNRSFEIFIITRMLAFVVVIFLTTFQANCGFAFDTSSLSNYLTVNARDFAIDDNGLVYTSNQVTPYVGLHVLISVYNSTNGNFSLITSFYDPTDNYCHAYIYIASEYLIFSGDRKVLLYYKNNLTFIGTIANNTILQQGVMLKNKNILVFYTINPLLNEISVGYVDLSKNHQLVNYLITYPLLPLTLNTDPAQQYLFFAYYSNIYVYSTSTWTLIKTLNTNNGRNFNEFSAIVFSGSLLIAFDSWGYWYAVYDIQSNFMLIKNSSLHYMRLYSLYYDQYSESILGIYGINTNLYFQLELRNWTFSYPDLPGNTTLASSYSFRKQGCGNLLGIYGYNSSSSVFYLMSNTLATFPCPISTFLDLNGNCLPCPSYCIACSLGVCTSCYYQMGTCCTPGQYFNNQINNCISCSNDCLTCISTTVCTNCIIGLYPTNGFCCSYGFYYNSASLTCDYCLASCYTCSNNYSCDEAANYQIVFIYCTNPQWNNNRVICNDWYTNPYIKAITEVNRFIISSPGLRNALKIFSPLFVFNDQYWYYSYHNRNYTRLIVTSTFFLILQEVNSQRLFPYFLSWIGSITSMPIFDSFFSNTNYTQRANQGNHIPDGEMIYFILGIQAMIVWYYGGFIFTLIIVKITCSFLQNYIQKKYLLYGSDDNSYQIKIAAKIRNTFVGLIHPSSLFKGLIQFNIFIFVFEAIRQIKILYSSSFSDIINLTLAFIFLFICLFYSCCFYLFLFIFSQNKKNTKIKKKYFSFRDEIYRAVAKFFVMGMIQGAFLHDYTTQIILLILLRVIFLISIIASKSKYLYSGLFVLDIVYYSFTIVFDVFLLYSYLVYEAFVDIPGWNTLNYCSLIEFICIFGMIGTVLIKNSFYFLQCLNYLRQIVGLIPNNKVQNQHQQSVSNNQQEQISTNNQVKSKRRLEKTEKLTKEKQNQFKKDYTKRAFREITRQSDLQQNNIVVISNARQNVQIQPKENVIKTRNIKRTHKKSTV